MDAGGADFSLEATGSAAVLRKAVDCTGPMAAHQGAGVRHRGTLDVNTILTGGRVVRGIVEEIAFRTCFSPG